MRFNYIICNVMIFTARGNEVHTLNHKNPSNILLTLCQDMLFKFKKYFCSKYFFIESNKIVFLPYFSITLPGIQLRLGRILRKQEYIIKKDKHHSLLFPMPPFLIDKSGRKIFKSTKRQTN